MVRVKQKCPNCGEGIIEFDVVPDCPPKPCSNPDHPAYSDPGDSGDAECVAVCIACGYEPTEDDEEAAIEQAGNYDPFDDYQGSDEDEPER